MDALESAKALLDDAIHRQPEIDAAVPAARAALDDCGALQAGETPVGITEIADLLGVKRQTADNWQQRGVLPERRWTVGGRPAWSWQRDIEPWARSTGRIR